MGKITEQLSNILEAPKDKLVNRVNELLKMTNLPPFSISIIYVNGKIYVNNNLALFGLEESQKLELLKNILTDALNSIDHKIEKNRDENMGVES